MGSNMCKIARWAVAATVVAMFTTTVVAQRVGELSGQRQPLDLSVDKLPEGFVPDDAEVVFLKLSPPEKDEFETTAQYQARVGNREVKALYAFPVQTHRW